MGEPGQSAARGRLTALLAAFSLSIALGSFLLFLVQPLIGRFILPWFGATPAVWTTCMLAFQTLLLAGYAYAHALTRSTSPKKQVMIHGGLLLISLAVFPIIPGDAWKPTSTLRPTLQITLLLAATVGLPFLALSAGAPLLQHWHARTIPGRSPYRLYALSNLGSLGALLAYPLVFELLWGAVTQAWIWSAAYLIYVAAFLGCAAVQK